MKKYYLTDGTAQQGPFTLEELQSKNISSSTPVWYDGLADWTTAGQLDELKDIIVHTPPPFHAPQAVEEVKPVAVVVAETTSVAPATSVNTNQEATPAATAKPAQVKSSMKPARRGGKTAWLSWVLYLLVFGGAGYFVYQDMEKNKGNSGTGANQMTTANDSATTANTSSETKPAVKETHEIVVTNDEASKDEATTAPVTVTTETKENNPPVAITTKSNQPVVVNEKAKPAITPATNTRVQQTEAQKLSQKKAEEENKKQQAAMAAAALKEKEYRNNWPKFISFGKIDYHSGDNGIEPFNVPVYNGTNAILDKVTVRVDYMKNDKKVFKSETVVIYNIPPGAGLNGKASGNSKGNNVKTFITGISSRKLHFCYPSNNGTTDDPYYCNQ